MGTCDVMDMANILTRFEDDDDHGADEAICDVCHEDNCV